MPNEMGQETETNTFFFLNYCLNLSSLPGLVWGVGQSRVKYYGLTEVRSVTLSHIEHDIRVRSSYLRNTPKCTEIY